MSLAHAACAETQRQLRSAALIERYDANLPRYTSYPTAAQFTARSGPADWAEWLARAPVDKPASLYIHIPFCRTLCLYCACTRVP